MLRPSARAERVEPFYVMEVVKAAARLEAQGRSIIHLSIGEPDFGPPQPVLDAASAAIAETRTGYTPALGLSALRERIAEHYLAAYGVCIDPMRIAVTAGASAALLLALAALLDEGRDLLLADPGYPCNRHFATVVGSRAVLVPCGPAQRFQLSEEAIARHWRPATAGVLLASPSNPTGTSIEPQALDALLAAVRERDGFSVVDEIYLGLTYDHAPATALGRADDIAVINSFSKYFSMTGWRLGWLVIPPDLVPAVERLAQNLYICASAIAQHAALACFDAQTLALCEARRLEFKRRRDYLVPALRDLGLGIPSPPDGAFYIYADVSALTDDSWRFAFELLDATGVCVVPGRDFGKHAPERYVRISYATAFERLEEAIERLRRFIASRPPPRSQQ
jgi:aspartate/methionine/tyrosine aminotransferase